MPIRVVIAARESLGRTTHDALASAGILVTAECRTAAELIAAVSRERPDVCVVDRDLQGGAFTATAAITVPGRKSKVLVLGGRPTRAEMRAARLAGAADCLPGDIDPAGLAAAVSALVKKEKP
jgi:DNA-binding NarL/FixJ family response regulator